MRNFQYTVAFALVACHIVVACGNSDAGIGFYYWFYAFKVFHFYSEVYRTKHPLMGRSQELRSCSYVLIPVLI